jgi:hypothetical protein
MASYYQILLKMRIFAHYELLAQHNRDILLKVSFSDHP